MLKKVAAWLPTLKGTTMRKHMIGDTVVVVIDEIGEVTFCHECLFDRVGVCSDMETAERTMAAIVELLVTVGKVLPVSAAGFEVEKALELLLRDFEPLTNRLSEQFEFSQSARKG
jgi:hypothetical protein